MLHNVYAPLVTAHGWSGTARTNPGGAEGNIVFLHLFIDALLLQPCNPTCKAFSFSPNSACVAALTLMGNGQSSRPGMRGSRRTQIDMAARTYACYGMHLRAGAWV